jgi:hypothetical protein
VMNIETNDKNDETYDKIYCMIYYVMNDISLRLIHCMIK